ncbi:MAG: ECF transporter S component [Ruminococcus sp.]|nr:ECF transporter S component [Ruminococcus sp.]
MQNSKNAVKILRLAQLGLLAALMLLLAYTPLGYLNIGPLAITFNTVPVAIAAIILGPVGGAVIGGMFGLTSFMQCFGGSALGTALFAVNPFLTVIQCFVPRIADGLIIGLLADLMRKRNANKAALSFVTAFLAPFLNTLFYMSSLILLFGNSEVIASYRNSIAPGKNVFLFVCAFVGVNAVVEWIAVTGIAGAVGCALLREARGKRQEAGN